MKRIALYFAAVACCAIWAFSSTTASAGKVVSYNSSYGQPVKIIKHGLNGTYRGQASVKSEYNLRFVGSCLVYERTTWTETYYVTYVYGEKVDSGVEVGEPTTQTVQQFCF